MSESQLYGIFNSNRKGKDFWGKNRFNSSFPVGLANYMRDKKINAKYINLDSNLKLRIDDIDIGEVYGAPELRNEDLYFGFEQKFEPYQKYCYETITNMDLIVKKKSGAYLRPLEVKLTVIPDSTTKDHTPSEWSPELVIRPPTTIYCALGMIESCSQQLDEVREIFEETCRKIGSWQNTYEICSKMDTFIHLINEFEKKFHEYQKPLLMQPIWKTEGQSPIISENAFDIFVWSNFAFTKLFLDNSSGESPPKTVVTRPMRSTARLTRCLYEVSKSKKVNIDDIYRQMAFNNQTDKEFSVNGLNTIKYMKCQRLEKPIISRDKLFEIILNGGEKELMPERRFDQSIYFTMANR